MYNVYTVILPCEIRGLLRKYTAWNSHKKQGTYFGERTPFHQYNVYTAKHKQGVLLINQCKVDFAFLKDYMYIMWYTIIKERCIP